jgi:hypothetical protein
LIAHSFLCFCKPLLSNEKGFLFAPANGLRSTIRFIPKPSIVPAPQAAQRHLKLRLSNRFTSHQLQSLHGFFEEASRRAALSFKYKPFAFPLGPHCRRAFCIY